MHVILHFTECRRHVFVFYVLTDQLTVILFYVLFYFMQLSHIEIE